MKCVDMYLRIRRNQLGLTQQEVANRAGIQLVQYQRFELGVRDIRRASFQVAYKVFRVLEIDIDKFMNGEYCIQELLYRGSDGRLYTFETGEPVETVSTPWPQINMRYEQTSYTRNAPEIQRKCLVIRGAFFGGALPLFGGHENEGDMTLSHIFVHCNRQTAVN